MRLPTYILQPQPQCQHTERHGCLDAGARRRRQAQCAALCKAGTVYAMASEDMDSLTFATPRLTRNLLSPASAKLPVTEYEYDKVLRRLESMLSVSRQRSGHFVFTSLPLQPSSGPNIKSQVSKRASKQAWRVCHGGRSGCCAATSNTHEAGRCPLCRWSRGWASRATSSWTCASCAAADYAGTIRGIGAVRALQLVQKHGAPQKS